MSLNANGVHHIDRVEFEKHQTTLYFSINQKEGNSFRFLKSTHLIDEQGHRYRMKKCDGFKIGEWTIADKDGVKNVSISFEPLPEDTRVFDCVEGPDRFFTFQFYGIREKGQTWDVFSRETVMDNAFDDSFFQADTVYVTGRIANIRKDLKNKVYRESLPNSQQFLLQQYRENNGVYDLIYVEKDGTFSFKTIVATPCMDLINIADTRILALLIPGDHLHLEINNLGEYNQQVTAQSDHGDYSRLLANHPFFYDRDIISPAPPLSSDSGMIALQTWSQLREKQEKNLEICRYIAVKNHFSPTEEKLLRMTVETNDALLSLSGMRNAISAKFVKEWEHYREHGGSTPVIQSEQELEDAGIHLDFSFLKKCDLSDPVISATPRYESLMSNLAWLVSSIRYHSDANPEAASFDSINAIAASERLEIGEPLMAHRIMEKATTVRRIPYVYDVELGQIAVQSRLPHIRSLAKVALTKSKTDGFRESFYPIGQLRSAHVVRRLVSAHKDKKVILFPVDMAWREKLQEMDSLYRVHHEELDKEVVFLPFALHKYPNKKTLKKMQQKLPLLNNAVYVKKEDFIQMYQDFQLLQVNNPERMILPDDTYSDTAFYYLGKFKRKR